MSARRDPVSVWLVLMFLCVLVLNLMHVATQTASGHGLEKSFRSTAMSKLFLLRNYIEDDSWEPMLQAYNFKKAAPGRGLYDLFFDGQVKFQYPPTSLVFFHWIPAPELEIVKGGLLRPLLRWLSLLSKVAVMLTVFGSAAILAFSAARFVPASPQGPRWILASRLILCSALGFIYFPLMYGYELGQIQVFIDAFAALAILCLFMKKDLWAGMFVGFCCMIKPQYAVLLAWGLLRKRWSYTLGFSVVVLAGLAFSLAVFGWSDHVSYLKVLKALSLQGEGFWPNQSVNGLLNRWLGNSDAVTFSATEYAPYHPWIYAATTASSIGFLAAALWPQKNRLTGENGVVDFSVVLIAATIASPIAWEHHYGVFLPVFAASLPILMRFRPLGEATAPLLFISYAWLAQVLLQPDLIFRNRWTGLVGSHFFYGGLILFGLLLALRKTSGAAQKNA